MAGRGRFTGKGRYAFLFLMVSATLLGISLADFSSSVIRFGAGVLNLTGLEAGEPGAPELIARRKRPWSDFENILTGPFFGLKGSDEPGSEQKPPGNLEGLSLVGVVSSQSRWASAAIRIKGEKYVNSYGIGDRLGGSGFKLVQVSSSSVVLEQSGARSILYLDGDDPKPLSKPDGKVLKSSISRTRLRKLLADKNAILGVKGTPFLVKGKMVGFKLHHVPKTHVFYSMGARSGDIVRKFNGETLSSPQQVFSIMQKLLSLSRARIDIERSGLKVSHEFVIHD